MTHLSGKSKYGWSAFVLLTSVALFFIYPADVILSGNQHIYFFWGMKNAGLGYLTNDFLAQEADPFPLFSYIVEFTESYLGQWFYYVCFWLACLVYIASLFGILRQLFREKKISTFWLPLATVFLFLHATPIWSFLLRHTFEIDLRWLWDNGFAEQGLLMGYFQPSSMGVLLLWSLERYLKRKLVLACVLAAVAGVFHANYLLVGGVMVTVYLALEARHKNWKPVIISALLALAITVPYVVYIYQNFTTAGMGEEEIAAFTQALDAVRQDNPHLDPKAWLNTQAALKLLLIATAAIILRNTRLYWAYASLIGLTLVLGAVALLSDNLFLINLAPWRLSVVLVPIATATVVYHSMQWLAVRNKAWLFIRLGSLLFLACMTLAYRIFGDFFRWDKLLLVYVVYGVFFVSILLYFRKRPDRQIRLACVAVIGAYMMLGLVTIALEEKDIWYQECGDIIEPNIKEEDKKNSLYLVPPKETYIRLKVGVPVYVDNNLYFSRNLANWKERKDFADWFYGLSYHERLANIDELKRRGITHIVWRGGDRTDIPQLEYVTERVFRIK